MIFKYQVVLANGQEVYINAEHHLYDEIKQAYYFHDEPCTDVDGKDIPTLIAIIKDPIAVIRQQ